MSRDTYPGGHTEADIEAMDRFDAFEAGMTAGKETEQILARNETLNDEDVWIVQRDVSYPDNLYVFTDERLAFELAGRYPGATVHRESILRGQFLIDTAEDDHNDTLTHDEVDAWDAGRTVGALLTQADPVTSGDEDIKRRAAWLRGKARLGVLPGFSADASASELHEGIDAGTWINEMRQESRN
jgi:hypothetical protein